jgi:hypothetical protein
MHRIELGGATFAKRWSWLNVRVRRRPTMLNALITLTGCLAALGFAAFVAMLAVAIVSVFATAIRSGPGGSSQVRRVNYVWFRRVQRAFYVAYALGMLCLLLQALRG